MREKILAEKDTKLKKKPIDSSLLSPAEYTEFPKHKFYYVTDWSKAENDHIKVTLDYGAGEWYFYDPHVYFPPTDDKVAVTPQQGKTKFLTEQDYVEAAKIIGCSVAAIKAVAKVESAGAGFYTEGKFTNLPVILYESHIFGSHSGYQFNASHPILSQRKWNRALYNQGGHSWDKLNQASKLNETAAIQACSWGKFQIMGFHYRTCGFNTPQEYAKAQHQSEFEHLRCFLAFVKSKRLDRHIRNLDWKAFAYSYNGEYYWKNQYDKKMAAAYASFA